VFGVVVGGVLERLGLAYSRVLGEGGVGCGKVGGGEVHSVVGCEVAATTMLGIAGDEIDPLRSSFCWETVVCQKLARTGPTAPDPPEFTMLMLMYELIYGYALPV
jgi:hypothetical protein